MPYSDNRPILVIATAEGCSGCDSFKNSTRNTLLQNLRKTNRLNIIEYNHPSVSPIESAPPEFHPQFGKWVGWFPCFLLYNNNSWINHLQPLKGSVYGGIYQNTGVTQDVSSPPATSDNIINWINRELTSDRYNNTSNHEPVYTGSNFSGHRGLPAGYIGHNYPNNNLNVRYGATIYDSGSNNNCDRGW